MKPSARASPKPRTGQAPESHVPDVKVALVSGNPGKLRELRVLLPQWEIEPLDTAGIDEETGADVLRQCACEGELGTLAGSW